jgi:hypothetical protein
MLNLATQDPPMAFVPDSRFCCYACRKLSTPFTAGDESDFPASAPLAGACRRLEYDLFICLE